ncbi:MAG: hypothetical protein AAFW74_01145 [Pseudomonadota bacterium]
MRIWIEAVSIAIIISASVQWAAARDAPQLRLADDLDYPGEGYCIDVPGVGETARTDLPLVAHNCLPERRSVDRVALERDGRLFMPAFNACVTAFGVNTALPGSPVLLRPCGASESFLSSGRLQRFDRTAENRLRLRDTALCLTVGADAAPTFSPVHRWRTLTMEDCNTAPLARSVWA